MWFCIWWEFQFVTTSTLIFYEQSTVNNTEVIVYGRLKWKQNTLTLIHGTEILISAAKRINLEPSKIT